MSSGGSKVYGGFGISNGKQSAALSGTVEAVVAGSVFVRTINENCSDEKKLFEAVKNKAKEISGL